MTPRSDLHSAVAAIRSLFSAAATSCAIVDEDGEHLRFSAADGAGADRIVGVDLPVGRGIAGFVAMSGQAIAVAEVQRDPRFARDVAESTEYVPHTIVAAPILSPDGEVTGVLSVLDPTVDESSGWTLAVLGTLATLVGQLLATRSAGHTEESSGSPTAGDDLAGVTARVSTHGSAGRQLATDVLSAVAAFLDESDR